MLQPRKEKEVEWLEFHNTEFQEFLAAKELDRLASSGQVVYDFAVQPEFKKIYPNWYDVLRYLVEINPRHIFPLLEFLKQQKEGWVENAFWGLLAGIDPNEMSKQERARIFDRVFTYVQETPGVWVVHNLVNLGAFFEKENYHLVKEPPVKLDTKDGQRRFYNQVDILDDVLLKLGDAEKENWKNIFKELAENHESSETKEIALTGLIHAGSIQDLSDLISVFEKGDAKVRNSFTYACHRLDVDAPFSISIFLEGLKDDENHRAIYGVNMIQNKEQLKEILRLFVEESSLLNKYLEGSDHYTSANEFGVIENSGENWDPDIAEWLSKLLQIIFSDEIKPFRKKDTFKKKTLSIILAKEPTLLLNLIEHIPTLKPFFFRYGQIIRNALTPDLANSLIAKCESIDSDIGWELIFYVFLNPHRQINEYEDEVCQIAKEHYPDIVKQVENQPDRSAFEAEQEALQKQNILKHFRDLLEPQPGMIRYEVFTYFRSHKDVLLELATEEEINKISDFLKNKIPNINPRQTSVEITVGEGGSTSYEMSYDVFYFENFVRTAEELGILEEIEIPRGHLINFLPLIAEDGSGSFENSKTLELIGELSKEDLRHLEELIDQKGETDYFKFSPVGLAKLARLHKIKSLVPLLKKFVFDDGIQYYNRLRVLEIITDYLTDEGFLLHVFHHYEESEGTDLFQIPVLANEKLIELFANDSAITWRIEYIKGKLAQKHEEPERSHGVARWIPPWEEEMHNQKMAKVLINLRSEQLIPKILDLLVHAFNLIKEDSAYDMYVNYLFKLVHQYYLGIKDKVSYGVLKELFSFIDTRFPKEKSLFSPYRTQLEIKYIQIHDKPVSIQPCINKYNEIKKRAYLPIYDVQDLSFLLRQIIDEDIRRFVHHQGFYKVVDKHFVAGRGNIQEDYIQKTLAIQMENALLKRGFREVDIIREPQLMDDKRIDLLVKYGFIQPIVIELKLLHNSEIVNAPKRSQYKSKLVQYMRSQGADHCIYLIFKVQPKHHETYFNALREEYKDMEGIFIPDFIDCTIN